jgi:hypothetical protein
MGTVRVDNKRKYLLDLEQRFEDLKKKDAGSMLTHQLQTILDRLNSFIGDNQDAVEQIQNDITIINQTTIINTEVPTVINDFRPDAGVWIPLNYKSSAFDNVKKTYDSDGSLTIEQTSGITYGNVMEGLVGVLSRFRLFPNENGKITIRAKYDRLGYVHDGVGLRRSPYGLAVHWPNAWFGLGYGYHGSGTVDYCYNWSWSGGSWAEADATNVGIHQTSFWLEISFGWKLFDLVSDSW